MVIDFWFYLTKSPLVSNWIRYAVELLGRFYLISPIVLLATFIWLATMTLDLLAENVAAYRSNPSSVAATTLNRVRQLIVYSELNQMNQMKS